MTFYWLNIPNNTQNNWCFSKYDSATNTGTFFYSLVPGTGIFRIGISVNGTLNVLNTHFFFADSTQVLATNTWYFITVVYNDNNKIYSAHIDGKFSQSVLITSSFTGIQYENLEIGSSTGGGGRVYSDIRSVVYFTLWIESEPLDE